MTFDQLIAFESVAKLKNFTKAAKSLHLTQPSVTNRIKLLEEEFGVSLFIRHNQSLELTKEGEKVLLYSQQIFALIRRMRASVGQMSDGITIGATPTLSIYNVPKLVKQLKRKSFEGRIAIKHGTSFELLNMILSGSVDIALVLNRIDHPDIIVKKLRNPLEVSLVASKNHPILQEQRVTCEILSQKYEVMLIHDHGEFWDNINKLLTKHNMNFNSFLQVDSSEIAKQLLQVTSTTAFMPLPAISKELKQALLHTVTIEDMPPLEFPVYLIYHKQLSESMILQHLLDILK